MIVTSNPMRDVIARYSSEFFKKYINIPVISINIETTGLNCQKDALLQVSAVKYCFDVADGKFNELDSFNLYVKHVKHIPPAVTAINGITDNMVMCATPVDQAYKMLSEFCGTEFIGLFYNAPFVISWLKWGHIMYGVPFEPMEVFDAYRIVQDVCGSAKESLKLRTVCDDLGISPEGRFNDALHDARCVLMVFESYFPKFINMLNGFPKGNDFPHLLSIEKLDPNSNDPIFLLRVRYYGEIILDTYAGTFSNAYDCFDKLNVNQLETVILKHFHKTSLRDIK